MKTVNTITDRGKQICTFDVKQGACSCSLRSASKKGRLLSFLFLLQITTQKNSMSVAVMLIYCDVCTPAKT
jgi:hypothetical protein